MLGGILAVFALESATSASWLNSWTPVPKLYLVSASGARLYYTAPTNNSHLSSCRHPEQWRLTAISSKSYTWRQTCRISIPNRKRPSQTAVVWILLEGINSRGFVFLAHLPYFRRLLRSELPCTLDSCISRSRMMKPTTAVFALFVAVTVLSSSRQVNSRSSLCFDRCNIRPSWVRSE